MLTFILVSVFPLDSKALKSLILSQREQLASRDAEIEHLKLLIAKLRRMEFGQSSEKSNFYDVTPPNEDLVWTGVSGSFNPKNADKAIAGLVKLVVKRLEKEAILAKNP